MRLTHNDLDSAVKANIISSEQANHLWSFWQREQDHIPQFRFSHILFYFGGLLAITAVTLFVTTAWDALLGIPLFIISFFLFCLGLYLTHYFLNKKLVLPAGIMATFSLAVVPLAIYNVQAVLGLMPIFNIHYQEYHQWVAWYWVPMELGTLLIGVIMLYFYRFPFLLFPISITLWYMSMDLGVLFLQQDSFIWRALFSLYFGLIILMFALYVDFRTDDTKKDYAFWLYIFGVIAFWSGLSCQYSDSELAKFFYLLINIFMIIVSVILNRRVFAIFGVFGVLGYLGYLAFSLFANSIGFPLVLVLLGMLLIFAAIAWTRVEQKLLNRLRPYIPKKILQRME